MFLKKFAFIHIIVIYATVAFATLNISLQSEGRYFLPIKDRFQPDLISISESKKCLSYDAVNAKHLAVVDFELGVVFLYETIDGEDIYAPRAVSIDSFLADIEWERWQIEIKNAKKEQKEKKKKIEIPMENLPPGVRTIIGTGGAGLAINGSYKISLSGRSEWSDNEAYMGSKWPQLQMEQDSRFTITGNIGSKIKVKVDQDSQRETDLENTININYKGEEDDVVQSIEAGNTTLALKGASLIGYSERVQGLFGIKSVFQVGDWNITAIASQEKANTQKGTFHPSATQDRIHIEDYEYKHRTYYYISDEYASFTFNPEDSISFFELYSTGLSGSYIFGWVLVNPGNSPDDLPSELTTSDSTESGYFVLIDPSQYFVNRKAGWFRLNTPAGSNDIIGVRYIVSHTDGTADTVGFASGDTVYLKMIKPSTLTSDHPCWNYEWRNVYDLNMRDIQLDETFIHLFRKITPDSIETTPDNSNVFMLTWYGMDSIDVNGDLVPNGDGIVDQSSYYIDASRGELIFTVPHPFDPQDIDVAISPGLANFPDSLRNPAIYNSTSSTDWGYSNHMFIFAEVKGFSTVINLNAYNIIPGSEVVKLNGEKLIKDQDYSIIYEIGQVRLLSDRARDPNASIEITYEAQPLFALQQKTLLGSRIQYDLGENSWFGITGLYKGVTTPERRPRVGGEPSQTFLYDSDLRLSQDLPFLTSAIDALPLLQTDTPSNVTLSLEAAQILSNPNTLGEAYLDDFEGSKGTDQISITRTMWTPASPPAGYSGQPRAKVIWYNPYDRVPVRDIWPNREVRSEESSTDVLHIEFYDTTTVPGDSLPWGGVMQYINPAYQDQQNAQFLEVWVKGDEGILSIDIGRISEDANDNGHLDTEDKPVGGIYDNILNQDEDTGLDTLFDVDEPGYDPITNPDPDGDDWSYNPDVDPNDYSHINGTEGNIKDPIGIRKPDTEDLNRDGVLSTFNEYFEFQLDLSSDIFVVDGTEYNGWRLYRIPLMDSLYTTVDDGRVWHRTEVGNPDFQNIKYIRLWLTGVEDGHSDVEIAQISFVHNQWDEDFDHFEIAVKNSQEDQDYEPPPGVAGERDPTTGLTQAEQSLVLKYKNLPPLDTVYAIKTLTDAEDYTQYGKLTMWVYFDSLNSEGTPPIFFFRMGDDQGSFYEYRTMPLKNGWSESNKIEIPFDDITFFKEQYQEALSDTADTTLPDSLTADGKGYYHIIGSPTLTNIKRFEVGIINPDHNFPISGEVWCDELVISDIRKENGRAYKGELSINAADFATFNANITKTDDDFHGLTSTNRTSSYGYHSSSTNNKATILTQTYTGNFILGKFYPVQWGVNLPLSISYTRASSVPRLMTNSDVVVPDTLRDEQKTVTTKKNLSLLGMGIAPEEPSPAMGIFVIPNKLSYSYQNSQSTSPTTPVDNSTNYQIMHTYNLSPKIESARWVVRGEPIDSSRTGKGRGALSISYVPSSIYFNTKLYENITEKTTQYGTHTTTFSRTLNHDTKLQYKPIETVTTHFNLSLERDIHAPDWFHFGPPTIFGKGNNKVIDDGINWSPKSLKFLSQRYDLMANYSENTKNPTAGTFGSVVQRRTFKSDLTLNWSALLGESGRSSRGRRSSSSSRDTTGASAAQSAEKEESQVWTTTKSIIKKLNNLRLTFSWDEQNKLPSLESRPGKMFQFGFSDDPGVSSYSEYSGTNSESKMFTKTLNISTGAKLPKDVSLTTRYKFTSTRTISVSSNTKSSSQTFPDISAKWGFVNKMKFFKKFANSTNASSNWNHNIAKNFTEDVLQQRTSSDKFSPFIGMNFSMKGGWTLDLKYNLEMSQQETYTANQISYLGTNKNTFNATAKYSIRAKKGIKIPLFGTITFENNLTLSITAIYSKDKSATWTQSDPREQPTKDNSELSIKPKALYNLSRNATAGLEIEVTEDTDNRIGNTRHIRDVKLWVQFQFGGGKSFRR